MRVCRYDEGNTKVFRCPYHSWTYKTDGTLIGVQDYEKAYQPPFDKSKWGLTEVAQLANYMGTIWATWDKDAPSFEEYLGDARFGFDQGLCAWDGGDGGTELLGSVQKWKVPCNWKFVAENFAGDWLHGVSHRSVDLVRLSPSGNTSAATIFGQLFVTAYPQGHGMLYSVYPVRRRRQYAMSPATSSISEMLGTAPENKGELAGTCRWSDDLPNVVSRPTAAHAADLPSDRAQRNRDVANVLRRQGGAGGDQAIPAGVLHALFGPGRHDRAG
jgi:phenylpropionate dioxygenase-like ring-hydroxylating dioxygenase large terminal subunit